MQALLWQAGKSPKEIMDFREQMVSQIELAAEELRLSGKAARTCFAKPPLQQYLVAGKNDTWLRKESDAITYEISKGVSGFLLQELVLTSAHCDSEVAELFRKGLKRIRCNA